MNRSEHAGEKKTYGPAHIRLFATKRGKKRAECRVVLVVPRHHRPHAQFKNEARELGKQNHSNKGHDANGAFPTSIHYWSIAHTRYTRIRQGQKCEHRLRIRVKTPTMFFCVFVLVSHSYFPASGQAVVPCVVFPPPPGSRLQLLSRIGFCVIECQYSWQ